MIPAFNRRGRLKATLSLLLAEPGSKGEVYLECSIDTSKGVKAAEVAWSYPEFVGEYGEATPLPLAPEIGIEILSPSNSPLEMNEKNRSLFGKRSKISMAMR